LFSLPIPVVRDVDETIGAAISAGEMLIDSATRWHEATAVERRDILWAIVGAEGIVYDLERWALVGIVPRTDIFPVLALGLPKAWEHRDDGLWLREEHWSPKRTRPLEHRPPTPERKLNPEQCEQARLMVEGGMTLRQVAAAFEVSYSAIWRVMHMKDQHPEQKGRGDEAQT